jgi:hypothetical protein
MTNPTNHHPDENMLIEELQPQSACPLIYITVQAVEQSFCVLTKLARK